MKQLLLVFLCIYSVALFGQKKFVESIDINTVAKKNPLYNDSTFDFRLFLRDKSRMNDTITPDNFSPDLFELTLFARFTQKKRQKRLVPITYSDVLSGICKSYIDFFGEKKIQYNGRVLNKYNRYLSEILLNTKYQYGLYKVFCFRVKMIRDIKFFYDSDIKKSAFNLYRGNKILYKNDATSASPVMPYTHIELVNQFFGHKFRFVFDEWMRVSQIKEFGCSVAIDPSTLNCNKTPEVVMVFITSTSRITDPEKIQKKGERARSWKKW